ncbi:MAG: hypothetical protein JRI52_04430 [Deltaproteobacteria bacterium]|nr:hypothetical protein [Deltaproteobacteria bacterium]
MKTWTRSIIASILALFLIVNHAGFAQESIDQKRLGRDLRIMEGVLSKLLNGRESSRAFNGHTKGVFLPDFGIVFHTSKQGHIYRTFSTSYNLAKKFNAVERRHIELRDKMEEQRLEVEGAVLPVEERSRAVEEAKEKEIAVIDEFLETDPEDVIKEEQQRIKKFKDHIALFLKNYTSAIGQLKPDHRIAVLVNLKDWRLIDTENGFLTGWITKSDIDRYRRQEISEGDLLKQIHYELIDKESDIDLDISIFSEILDRAMIEDGMLRNPSNTGIYLKGLGALLFMDLPQHFFVEEDVFNSTSIYVHSEENNALIYKINTDQSKKNQDTNRQKRQEYVQQIRDNIFELIASYGHTLRIQPQESVIFKVDLGRRFILLGGKDDNVSQLIMKLNKKDLDDFNRGVLTLSALRSKLVERIN